VGRQTWEFDSEAGSDDEREEVEIARQNFYQNRFQTKACADRIWRFQVLFNYNIIFAFHLIKLSNTCKIHIYLYKKIKFTFIEALN